MALPKRNHHSDEQHDQSNIIQASMPAPPVLHVDDHEESDGFSNESFTPENMLGLPAFDQQDDYDTPDPDMVEQPVNIEPVMSDEPSFHEVPDHVDSSQDQSATPIHDTPTDTPQVIEPPSEADSQLKINPSNHVKTSMKHAVDPHRSPDPQPGFRTSVIVAIAASCAGIPAMALFFIVALIVITGNIQISVIVTFGLLALLPVIGLIAGIWSLKDKRHRMASIIAIMVSICSIGAFVFAGMNSDKAMHVVESEAMTSIQQSLSSALNGQSSSNSSSSDSSSSSDNAYDQQDTSTTSPDDQSILSNTNGSNTSNSGVNS
jgi:hypothetical protein